jgi:enoyl-CoA hydratase
MTTSDVLSVERDGHVATVWLDNPARRNAMGRAFFAGIGAVAAELGDDPDVRAVVLAARGPCFTVGLDLKEMGSVLTGGGGDGGAGRVSDATRRLAGRRQLLAWQRAFSAVADCPKPVIAAVHGWCIGGGIDLICCADIRLASADARFSVRETKMAIVADLGTLQRLPLIVGAGHVAELAFTGKDVDAARAKEIGLVNAVHDDADALHDAARALAAEIAANPPLVVQGVKQVLRAGRDLTVEQGLDYVSLWNAAFLQSDDLGEAMAAFLEKRPPRFSGT